MDMTDFTVRLAEARDVLELHRLVRAAYQELADMGLNLTGTYQDEATTRARMEGVDVFLVCGGDGVVATVSLGLDDSTRQPPALYVTQLAVLPALKRCGIGRALLRMASKKAHERNIPCLRLDTAIPATHLVNLHRSEGYTIIDEVQWEGKTYRSYIMEKRL